MQESVRAQMLAAAALFQEAAASTLPTDIEKTVHFIIESLRGGGKILIFGNGGSAADSQHAASELVGRFRRNRLPFAAIALTTDTSILTAVANDFGYEQVFSRQVNALLCPGDIVIAISTSGNSPSVVQGAAAAAAGGGKVVAMTAGGGGRLKDHADVALIMPSTDTPRVQELHIGVLHIICDLVEEALVGRPECHHTE